MGLGSLVAGYVKTFSRFPAADLQARRWWVSRTGKYTALNLVCGVIPLFGLIPIIFMRENSGFIPKWFSVFPIGFGNAVVFVTVISAKFF